MSKYLSLKKISFDTKVKSPDVTAKTSPTIPSKTTPPPLPPKKVPTIPSKTTPPPLPPKKVPTIPSKTAKLPDGSVKLPDGSVKTGSPDAPDPELETPSGRKAQALENKVAVKKFVDTLPKAEKAKFESLQKFDPMNPDGIDSKNALKALKDMDIDTRKGLRDLYTKAGNDPKNKKLWERFMDLSGKKKALLLLTVGAGIAFMAILIEEDGDFEKAAKRAGNMTGTALAETMKFAAKMAGETLGASAGLFGEAFWTMVEGLTGLSRDTIKKIGITILVIVVLMVIIGIVYKLKVIFQSSDDTSTTEPPMAIPIAKPISNPPMATPIE